MVVVAADCSPSLEESAGKELWYRGIPVLVVRIGG